MTGRIIRLVCLVLMSMWITAKLIAFVPLFAIPFIGVTVWFMISEIREMRLIYNENKKKQKRNSRNQKVVKKAIKS